MTDQLLSGTSDEPPSALVPTSTSTEMCTRREADGITAASAYTDIDYQSETEGEKPVLLELGNASTSVYRSASDSASASVSNPVPVSISAPATIYKLDMHLNHSNSYLQTQVYAGGIQEPPPSHLVPLITSPQAHGQLQQHQHHHHHPQHISLYNNPYTQPPLAGASGITSLHVGAMHSGDYAAVNIPQTVCAWPISETDTENKPNADVVPPPLYITYSGAREHLITKETNPTWREKALQIEKDYKKTACDRERTRMRDMNKAFDTLRSKLPVSKPNGKKYSKIESLRIAINYINHLQQCLKESSTDIEATSFSTSNKPHQHQHEHEHEHKPNSAVGYVLDMEEVGQNEPTFHYESGKTTYKDVDKDLDESHSGAWSDNNSYISNGQNQWD